MQEPTETPQRTATRAGQVSHRDRGAEGKILRHPHTKGAPARVRHSEQQPQDTVCKILVAKSNQEKMF